MLGFLRGLFKERKEEEMTFANTTRSLQQDCVRGRKRTRGRPYRARRPAKCEMLLFLSLFEQQAKFSSVRQNGSEAVLSRSWHCHVDWSVSNSFRVKNVLLLRVACHGEISVLDWALFVAETTNCNARPTSAPRYLPLLPR